MADPRFFPVAGPFSVGRLAEIAEARMAPGGDPGRVLRGRGAARRRGARARELPRQPAVRRRPSPPRRAGACVVRPEMAPEGARRRGAAARRGPVPRLCAHRPGLPSRRRRRSPAIAPAATVDPTARLADGCRVEPGAVIGARRRDRARGRSIGANAVIGPGVVIGEDCVIGAGATVSHSLIGQPRQRLPGGAPRPGRLRLRHGTARGTSRCRSSARVIVEDDVEIGANTTIDRGAGPDTVIGAGTKIDNLVQIGHNVQVGRGCILVAQVGIAGSTRLGDFVVAGGQAGHRRPPGDRSGRPHRGPERRHARHRAGRHRRRARPPLPIQEFFCASARRCGGWPAAGRLRDAGRDASIRPRSSSRAPSSASGVSVGPVLRGRPGGEPGRRRGAALPRRRRRAHRDRRGHAHLPLRLHRAPAAGPQVSGRALAPDDRTRQHHPRVRDHEPGHRGRPHGHQRGRRRPVHGRRPRRPRLHDRRPRHHGQQRHDRRPRRGRRSRDAGRALRGAPVRADRHRSRWWAACPVSSST